MKANGRGTVEITDAVKIAEISESISVDNINGVLIDFEAEIYSQETAHEDYRRATGISINYADNQEVTLDIDSVSACLIEEMCEDEIYNAEVGEI